jgi:subtilisin-like proprotein convertase family protein
MRPQFFSWMAACAVATTLASGADGTIGRVRVTTIREADTARQELVAQRLATRFAASGHRFADVRVISLRPRSDDPRFDATIYDYKVERTFELVLDAEGKELERHAAPGQPARTIQEVEDAASLVREDAQFKDAIGKGALALYEAMPPVTVDADGRRLINVGVMSPPENGYTVERNEIVSVHIPSGTIVRHASGAPDTARALTLACGPASGGSCPATGTCSFYQIVWPAADPVWKLNVRHPSCTQSVQSQGTGLEITDVFYRDRLVLKRGEVPVLNVLYDGNTCGPYRDWLYSEDCFQATGTDVPSSGSGVRVASSAPATFCESSVDAGNFKGIAIYDQGDALWLSSETNAGWYRYIMEWRFRLDGTIEPIFGFGATSNSCTCNPHHHHAYWRLEWAVDGAVGDITTGINTLEHRRAGTTDVYDPVGSEATFQRDPASYDKDYFRVKNPQTGNGYVIQPGELDGSAMGDAYGKWDLAALALNTNQIDDQNADTSVNVTPWLNGEALGTTKRLVTWYRAGYYHDDPGGAGEACELAGPKLVPLTPCAGTLSLDRGAYACGGTIGLSATDQDLVNTGTMSVHVSSPTEPTPETVTLVETPAGSGRFAGSIATTGQPPVTGDGALSVQNGDTIDASYVDASSCGTPNVNVEKIAPVDCAAPSISNIQAAPAANTAVVSWTTSESATSVVHYGTAVPTGGQASDAAMLTSHSVTLTGLLPCTTYYYWVESGDAAGNLTVSNTGGGYRAFVTLANSDANINSADTPVSIPDNNPTGATSTINVPQAATVQDVNVTVNITHTWDGDLTLSLLTPTNASITLSTHHGNSGDDYTNTIFDDEATTPISSGAPPYTGSFRPDSPLTAADGINASGNWRLKVVDDAGQDIGTINTWNLRLTLPTGTCPAGNPPAPATALAASAITGGLHLTWGAGACPAPNYHLLYGSLAGLSTYALAGSVCGLGPTGSFDWSALPAGDLWFVVVSDNAAATEGSWGLSSTGERNGTAASAACGFTQRSNAGTCP